MATYQILMQLDNDSFYGREGIEVARILRKLAELSEEDLAVTTRFCDSNGNIVGHAKRYQGGEPMVPLED